MVNCSICKARESKGLFRFPSDSRRARCLEIVGLPPKKDLTVKVENLRICFRHYKVNDFYFVGNQVKIRAGKPSSQQNFRENHCQINLKGGEVTKFDLNLKGEEATRVYQGLPHVDQVLH